jgi:hypothetical protein
MHAAITVVAVAVLCAAPCDPFDTQRLRRPLVLPSGATDL